MGNIKSEDLIVKSNFLLESPCKLTLTEQKIIYMILRMINKDDSELKSYEFKIEDFIKDLELKGNSVYSELKSITRLLRSRTFTIKFTDKNLIAQMNGITELQTGWISEVAYIKREGRIVFYLSPLLKPFLLLLKRDFTELDFKNLKQLKSTYSTKIYELLKQYKNISGKNKTNWERVFTLEDLKEKLCIQANEYSLYGDFKKRVVLQAQKEINAKTDISFEFEEIKECRKVSAIKFIIKSKNNNNPEPLKLPEKTELPEKIVPVKKVCAKDLDPEVKIIIDSFRQKYNAELSPSPTKKMIELKGIDCILGCLNTYANHLVGRTIKNIAGDFYTFVTKGYCENKSYISPVPKTSHIPQHNNFEQRTYTDEQFNGFLANNRKAK